MICLSALVIHLIKSTFLLILQHNTGTWSCSMVISLAGQLATGVLTLIFHQFSSIWICFLLPICMYFRGVVGLVVVSWNSWIIWLLCAARRVLSGCLHLYTYPPCLSENYLFVFISDSVGTTDRMD
jgi:hypothetical protein